MRCDPTPQNALSREKHRPRSPAVHNRTQRIDPALSTTSNAASETTAFGRIQRRSRTPRSSDHERERRHLGRLPRRSQRSAVRHRSEVGPGGSKRPLKASARPWASATSPAIRPEQGPWSRRRDACTTTKAGLRRRGGPKCGCSTPGAAISWSARWWLLSCPSRRAPTNSGKLLRFLPMESGARTGAGTCSVARAGAPRACLWRADSTTGKQLATAAFWQGSTWTTSDLVRYRGSSRAALLAQTRASSRRREPLRLTRSTAGLPASETLERPNARPSA
jgi:hypothetical protein